MVANFEALLAETQKKGWAIGDYVHPWRLSHQASGEWLAVPNRTGGSEIDELRPTTRADAHPHSLSAKYGTAAQPLHTDGAHHAQPPDLIVLFSKQASQVPTRVWRPSTGSDSMRHGVFIVDLGPQSFFTTAFSRGKLRYDPGCMTPCDDRAREAAAFLHGGNDEAEGVEWVGPSVLMIDNRSCLHGRADASEEPGRSITRVSLRKRQS